jgi:glycosyltransferase involved in cell wall biosynthesis
VIVEQPLNIGMIGNFNACLSRASGDFFLMLSDDDLLEPTAIELLCAPLIGGLDGVPAEEIGIAWCPCTIINANGASQWETSGGPHLEGPAQLIAGLWNGIRGPRFSSVMVRTRDAIAVGGYDERYGVLCDSPNWAKVALAYKHVVCLEEPLVQYRTHASSASHSAACIDWQRWGEAQFADLHDSLKLRGLSEKELRNLKKNLLANLTVTVLLPTVGQPKWLFRIAKEVLRSWRYFLTAYVARRVLREFWKLVRLTRAERRA